MSKFSLALRFVALNIFRTTMFSSPWFNLWCHLTWIGILFLLCRSFPEATYNSPGALIQIGALMFAGASVIVYVTDFSTPPRYLNLKLNRQITLLYRTMSAYKSLEAEIRSAIVSAEHNDVVVIQRRKYVKDQHVDLGDHIVRRIKAITSSVTVEMTEQTIKVKAL